VTGERLAEICDAAGTVSRETLDRLTAFEREFRRWSQRINLAAPSTLEHLWSRHILDSAQLASIEPEALRWLDLGSGGGFPGAILAILLAERPGAHIDLIESNHKKAAFLRTTIGALGVPGTVHICRIEQATSHVAMPELVTARALAPLPHLLALASPWLTAGARSLFHKGRDYRAEIVESRDAWQFDLIEHVSKIDPQSRILGISGLARARPTDRTRDGHP
jgi:16S rRNA (guanine527-N7)-methyltransferase